MLCTYIRSSLINNWKLCELQTLLTYTFGFKNKAGAAASGGSCVHKILELRALGSINEKLGNKEFEFDTWGKVDSKWAQDIDQTIDRVYAHQQTVDNHIKWEKMPKSKVLKWAKKAITDYPQYDPVNLNIIQVEQYFDIEITEKWAAYSTEINGKLIEGNLRLKGTIDCILDLGNGVYECFDYKGLPLEAPIPTPDGWSTMGNLRVGDTVYDQYGATTTVEAKSKIKTKNCYKITFDDTSTAECDFDHYWTLWDGDVVLTEDLEINDKINVALPIDCEDKELPIDPYVLGIWLGDGRNRGFEITSGDKFVFEEIERRGYKLGTNQKKRDINCETKTVLDSTKYLRTLSLLNNKHIPPIYLRASHKQRLDLLRGLMDSDGLCNVLRKQCIFTNCTKQLSEGVSELLLTLGQRPLISRTKTSCSGISGVGWPVSFRPNNINPFLLPIKANKVDPNWGPGKSEFRRITEIEKIGSKLTQCISVDSPDKTYLCTKSFIPTHNSGAKRACFSTGVEKDLDYLKTDHQLLFYYYALKKLYPDKSFIMSLYFINAGGIFSVPGNEEMLKDAESMIKSTFREITKVKYPTLLDATNRDFRCKHCCAYSKPGPETGGKSVCAFYHEKIKEDGLLKTIETYADLSKLNAYGVGAGKIQE